LGFSAQRRAEVVALSSAAPCCNPDVKSSPRIDRRLVQVLPVLDDPSLPVAETHRRLGAVADSLEVPRPNYESVRRLVRAHRSLPPSARTEALLDLLLYTRSPTAAFQDLLSGESSR
jgi:hypothetical protein